MKPKRLLAAAAVLWALVVLSTAMLTPGTFAQYAAGAIGGAIARVAAWDVFIRGKKADEPLLLIFEEDEHGAALSCTTVITLANNSDVTARYVLVASWDEESEDTPQVSVETNAAYLVEFGPYDEDNGIVLPYAQSGVPTEVKLDVTIQPGNFTGLKIDAFALQID